MKNVIGTPARGSDFFERPREIKKLTRSIKNGAHIQLAAPRRVGKTSVLMYLLDNPMEGFEFIYIDTEAVDNESDFFRKIFKDVIKCKSIKNSKKFRLQLKEKTNTFLKNVKSLNASGNEIELNEIDGLNYYEELANLIKGIVIDKKIVLMIDEFPYTISNILEKNADGEKAAISFLQLNRALRHDPDIHGKVQFIYTGSIGLNTTVERINATALINDIESISVSQLTEKEAHLLICKVLESEEMTIPVELASYILVKIQWLTPFYIKLIIKEMIDLLEDDQAIDQVLIDSAFNEIIDFRNNNYFEHYNSRLKSYFNDAEFKFVVEFLSLAAENGAIDKNELYDLAVKHNFQENYRKFRNTLIHDGYTHSADDGDSYRYNSPILRMWWKNHVCK